MIYATPRVNAEKAASLPTTWWLEVNPSRAVSLIIMSMFAWKGVILTADPHCSGTVAEDARCMQLGPARFIQSLSGTACCVQRGNPSRQFWIGAERTMTGIRWRA